MLVMLLSDCSWLDDVTMCRKIPLGVIEVLAFHLDGIALDGSGENVSGSKSRDSASNERMSLISIVSAVEAREADSEGEYSSSSGSLLGVLLGRYEAMSGCAHTVEPSGWRLLVGGRVNVDNVLKVLGVPLLFRGAETRPGKEMAKKGIG